MKELKYLQRLLFLLAVGFSLSFVCACGDDEDDEPFNDPNTEQTTPGGNEADGDGTLPTDSIPGQDDPALPNDSIQEELPTDSIPGGGDVPVLPTDSVVSVRHEAVDLGLSVKWATCNVGATSPEEYGDYFAWGETTTKSSYDYNNCTTWNLSTSELQSRGIIGSDGNLTAAYDAASVNWGGSWRMPTLDEIKELLNNCTWTWTTQNGVNGYKVTASNGNSIFLPAAGRRRGTGLYNAGSYGHYWSATPGSDSGGAYYLYFGSDYYGWYGSNRYYGHTVRPVSDELLSGSEK